LQQRKKAVVADLKQLQAAAQPLLTVLDDAALMSQLDADKNFTATYLEQNHSVTAQVIDQFHRLAKLEFDIGTYEQAANHLAIYRQLIVDGEKNASALWGHFAAMILLQKWEDALKDMKELQILIDTKVWGEGDRLKIETNKMPPPLTPFIKK
jgi:hypothetical protein